MKNKIQIFSCYEYGMKSTMFDENTKYLLRMKGNIHLRDKIFVLKQNLSVLGH